jgi:hypothetical protein
MATYVGNRTLAKTILNSLALVTTSIIDCAALAQRHDPGTEAFSKTTANTRVSHVICPVNFAVRQPTDRNAVPVLLFLLDDNGTSGDSRVDVSLSTKPRAAPDRIS